MSVNLEDIARRYGVSTEAVEVLRAALRRGGGRQAQFSHRDFGGMGQWSSGGMTQVGDMFNSGLRDKVAALCSELANEALEPAGSSTPATSFGWTSQGDWWPQGLGRPSASGSQNGTRYACFPDERRIAIEQGGVVTLYDSGEHRIGGVSQQQSGSQDLSFSSQIGTVRASDLPVIGPSRDR